MAKIVFKSVDEYIEAQPQEVQAALNRVRSAIRRAPTYKLGGTRLLHFAGWKTHFALYVSSKPILEKFERELRPYDIEKGTIRFPLSETVPEKLIERIAAFIPEVRHAR